MDRFGKHFQKLTYISNDLHMRRADVARYLGVSYRTVIRYEQLGGLPVHKIKGSQPIYIRSEVDEWLRNQ